MSPITTFHIPPLSSFHLFTSLPPELRFNIWSLALHPLPTRLIETSCPQYYPPRTEALLPRFRSTHGLPPLLSTCHESRHLALKSYTPLTIDAETILVNLTTDMILIKPGRNYVDETIFNPSVQRALACVPRHAQRLAVPMFDCFLVKHVRPFCEFFDGFRELREIVFYFANERMAERLWDVKGYRFQDDGRPRIRLNGLMWTGWQVVEAFGEWRRGVNARMAELTYVDGGACEDDSGEDSEYSDSASEDENGEQDSETEGEGGNIDITTGGRKKDGL